MLGVQPLAGLVVSLDNITGFDKKTNSFNASYYYCPVLESDPSRFVFGF
jgi:hypothetical protein